MLFRFFSHATLGLLVAATLSGCSDDSKSTDVSLDDNQKLSTLTDAQIGALCDWSNDKQGGYGSETKCSDGSSVSAQKDQAACKAEDGPTLKNCDQTVATYKACTLKIAMHECDISPALLSDECVPLLPCLAP
jgi:hypothetical protein